MSDRRYDLLDVGAAPRAVDVASYLARIAFFEAASVDAFDILARDLGAHRAPASLLRSCRSARNDELRHTRMASTLASRHGASFAAPPAHRPREPRDIEAIAIENAAGGCVREAFGVRLAAWQAEHAPTEELRAFFARLVRDEARHAALAWRIDAWLSPQLDGEARARVVVARARALAELEASLDEAPVAGLGLPDPATARELFAVWRAAAFGARVSPPTVDAA
jgi:hypothetical protein